MFLNGSGQNEYSLQRTFQKCFLPSFGSFGKTVSEKNFKNWPIRNKNCMWQPCLLTNRDKISNFYRGPSIDASYQISVHLWKRFQRFVFISTNQKQEWPVAPMFVNGSELNEHLYRGPSNDASYQVLIHLARRFQRRRFFRNQPTRNKNGLWRPCLLTDRDEISNL